MKIETTALQAALTAAKPALSKKAITEQTDHYIFDNGCVRTYNDTIAISVPFDVGFTGAVKADEFYQLVSKIKAKQIDMDLDNEGRINIVAGTTEATIMTQKDIVCPNVEIDVKKWDKLPENFAKAAYFCSFSADTNDANKVLTCLWCVDGNIISTDRFRASRYKIGGKMPEILIKAKQAREAKNHRPVQYVITHDANDKPNWLHLKNETGAILSCLLIEGEYPSQVEDAFKQQGEQVAIPKELGEKIDIAKIIPDADENQGDIAVEVKKGKMILVGQGALGRIKEECDIKYDKKAGFKFDVAPEALLEIIAHTDNMYVGEHMLYFAGEQFEHIISLR